MVRFFFFGGGGGAFFPAAKAAEAIVLALGCVLPVPGLSACPLAADIVFTALPTLSTTPYFCAVFNPLAT